MGKIMKGSFDPIKLEEKIQAYMWRLISEVMGIVLLRRIKPSIKEKTGSESENR